MADLQLTDVPEKVIERLRRLAEREGSTLEQVAVNELAGVSMRVLNAEVLAPLSDAPVPWVEMLDAVSRSRDER